MVNEAGLDKRGALDIIKLVSLLLAASDRLCANRADAEAWPPDTEGEV